jgi:CRISPR-associated endonuclease Cas1
LASTNGLGLEIGRNLIRHKLEGQAKFLQRLPAPSRDFFEIPELIEELPQDKSPQELRRTEGQAAIIYWSAWSDIPVNFSAKDTERIPEHWLTFGQRHSLISKPSPRRAINAANAMLNYLCAILEAEARIAALRMGLDPGLALLHVDQKNRDSLPCDLMEAVRPNADPYVLDLLRGRTFKKGDFFETREGVCRLMPPLTHELAETSTTWAKELAPVTERVARLLLEAAPKSGGQGRHIQPPKPGSPQARPLPTPLTESNRSA